MIHSDLYWDLVVANTVLKTLMHEIDCAILDLSTDVLCLKADLL